MIDSISSLSVYHPLHRARGILAGDGPGERRHREILSIKVHHLRVEKKIYSRGRRRRDGADGHRGAARRRGHDPLVVGHGSGQGPRRADRGTRREERAGDEKVERCESASYRRGLNAGFGAVLGVRWHWAKDAEK